MIYDTIVFATIMDAWNSKLIGFNQDFDRLELIDFWKIKLDGSLTRLIFIVDTKKTFG